MATAAQKARISKLQSQATKLQSSLKTATGSAKATMQRSLARTNKAISSFSAPTTKSTTTAPPKTTTATKPTVTSPSRSSSSSSSYLNIPSVDSFKTSAKKTSDSITNKLSGGGSDPGYISAANAATIPKTDAGVMDNKYENLMAQYQMLRDLINKPKEDIPAYENPYADQMANLYNVINQRVMNPAQYDSNTDEALKVMQQNALLQARTQLGRRNQLGSASAIYGKAGELQALQQAIPQYQQMFYDRQQQNTANMFKQFGLTQDLDQTAYNRQRTAVSDQRADRQANIGEFADIVNLSKAMGQQDIQQQEDQYAIYDRYVANRGDNFDYQAEINKIMADDDPTNDWKIGVLNTHRQQKIRDWVSQIDQYKNDYKKEIDRREAEIEQNPNLTDPLIPYLKIARGIKIKSMEDKQLDDEQKQYKRAFELWEQGVSAKIVTDTLGLEEGAKSADYQDLIATIAQKQAQSQASLISANASATNAATNITKEKRLATEAKDKKTTDEETKKEKEYVTAAYGQYLEESIPYEEFFIKYGLGDRFTDEQTKLFQALVFKKEPSKDDDEFLVRPK